MTKAPRSSVEQLHIGLAIAQNLLEIGQSRWRCRSPHDSSPEGGQLLEHLRACCVLQLRKLRFTLGNPSGFPAGECPRQKLQFDQGKR